jgi:hypothetical protein
MGILQDFFDGASVSIEAGVFDDPPGELSWTPLILDALGVEELGQLARVCPKDGKKASATKRR